MAQIKTEPIIYVDDSSLESNDLLMEIVKEEDSEICLSGEKRNSERLLKVELELDERVIKTEKVDYGEELTFSLNGSTLDPQINVKTEQTTEFFEVLMVDEEFCKKEDPEDISYQLMGPQKVCSKCGQSCQTDLELTGHICQQIDYKRFKCKVCPLRFQYKRELKQHEKSHMSALRDCTCSKCGLLCWNFTELMKHMRQHINEKPYKCDLCHRSFPYPQNLTMHMNTHKNQKRCFSCDNCNESFTTEVQLNEHVRLLHMAQHGSFRCPYCPRTFSRNAGLRAHLRLHDNDRPYMCNFCPRAYSRRDQLKKHLQSHSSKNKSRTKSKKPKPSPASDSEEPSTTVDRALKVENLDADVDPEAGVQGGDSMVDKFVENHNLKFVCEICGIPYKQKYHLMVHKRWHTGYRPFKCNLCGKEFTNKQGYNNHTRMLCSIEQPYKCHVCPKAYGQRNHLVSHMRSHDGVCPYKCPYCLRKHPKTVQLWQHIKECPKLDQLQAEHDAIMMS
ncbi:zinc finger protein 660 [Drosophila willistoni]|nr:zinc finger protein 660 [Drosophila willistoni]